MWVPRGSQCSLRRPVHRLGQLLQLPRARGEMPVLVCSPLAGLALTRQVADMCLQSTFRLPLFESCCLAGGCGEGCRPGG